MSKVPKVTLLSWTPEPVRLIAELWELSKDNAEYEEIKRRVADNPDALELFRKVLAQNIPIAEHVSFVFLLENISISLREQLVRHRIGATVGSQHGVDIVPDLAKSTFWSQSHRILDMSGFTSEGRYRMPKSIPAGTDADVEYRTAMYRAQQTYQTLRGLGVPEEDAREVLPMAVQHRISWGLNLQSLLHIVGKRSCWILQQGLWGPIIEGMVDELAQKVHAVFREIVSPPCVGAGQRFEGCRYHLENQRRITGDDHHPACPLWLCRHTAPGGIGHLLRDFSPRHRAAMLRGGSAKESDLAEALPMIEEMRARAEKYRALWGRDPYIWDQERQGELEC